MTAPRKKWPTPSEFLQLYKPTAMSLMWLILVLETRLWEKGWKDRKPGGGGGNAWSQFSQLDLEFSLDLVNISITVLTRVETKRSWRALLLTMHSVQVLQQAAPRLPTKAAEVCVCFTSINQIHRTLISFK